MLYVPLALDNTNNKQNQGWHKIVQTNVTEDWHFLLVLLKGTPSEDTFNFKMARKSKDVQNYFIFSLLSIITQQKYFFPWNLSSSRCSHINPFSTNEEQKKKKKNGPLCNRYLCHMHWPRS